ncbi:hypothetical protein E4U41_005375 [Claviceps citrina]|nr:hypothetical protein E4U41_005375 [Claviceps citrina]
MGNVALPVRVSGGGGGGGGAQAEAEADAAAKREEEAEAEAAAGNNDILVPPEHEALLFRWILDTLVADYRTFLSLFVMHRRYWVRLSAQIYLDEGDYAAAGVMLRELCGRIGKREYLKG